MPIMFTTQPFLLRKSAGHVSHLKQQRLDQVFPTPGANAGQILAPRTGRWAFLLVSARRTVLLRVRSISIRRTPEGEGKGDTAVYLNLI
jgi:hypothetical protein